MPTERRFELINELRQYGRLDDGTPSFLAEWEPVRFLGHGSFGEVYLIRGRRGEFCAVKIISVEDEQIEQYKAEIRALSRIRGEEHAVMIYEYAVVNVDRGLYLSRYMVIRMELLSRLPERMSYSDVIDMGIQMCDILNKCHTGRPAIIHCDIKPENILVMPDDLSGRNVYKLSDFGEAKISERTKHSTGNRGTPLYMSPEMNNYQGYDSRSDLYSLGVTMYALLNNGLVPFSNGQNSREALGRRFRGERLPDIPGVSSGMMNILRRLCEADPNMRFQSAAELEKALRALVRVRSTREVPAEEQESPLVKLWDKIRSRPGYAAAAVGAAVLAIVLGIVFGSGGKTRPEPETAVLPALSQTEYETPSGTVSPSALSENTVPEQVMIPSDLAVGDYIDFGEYPQSTDEPEPVSWRVLDIQDDQALVISRMLLDCESYNDSDEETTWENCTLRKKLNNDFYNECFTPSEREKIVLCTNTNPDSPLDTDGGNDTEDYIFCLSYYQVVKYFDPYTERCAVPTKYAAREGSFVSVEYKDVNGEYTGWWWLRTPGSDLRKAAFVNVDGSAIKYGREIDKNSGSVRPAMWLQLG